MGGEYALPCSTLRRVCRIFSFQDPRERRQNKHVFQCYGVTTILYPLDLLCPLRMVDYKTIERSDAAY